MTTININPTTLDALWALFKNQPQGIRSAFTRRLLKNHSEIDKRTHPVRHLRAASKSPEQTERAGATA